MLALAIAGTLLLGAANPVLPDVADAGVLRYAGRYYLMGVGTSGGMYVSNDLVHWTGPVHAFSMENAWATGPAATDDNIHACDLSLIDGVFHLYWSVNRGALRQIGHAVADAPTGPYREPERAVPFDGRIDPQCFQDDDGSLYFYTVKFGLGNIIWGQPMDTPWALRDQPKKLLTAVPNTWETLDKVTSINEGPFVTKYRGRYYMVYNSNHTSPKYGNYALGVAESDSALGFENATKYPFSVLRSSRDPKFAGVAIDETLPEVKNCGQPSLVRGPNGIEWWLVYFADQGGHRSQCIDRAHFFGHEIFVEGPTVAGTPGYHPGPARPSFEDLFDGGEQLESRWTLEGRWTKADGALVGSSEGDAVIARPRVQPGRSYVLESVIRSRGQGEGTFGIVAWDDGKETTLRFGLDPKRNAAYLAVCRGDRRKEHRVTLSPEFSWNAPHAVRVENNDGAFACFLDQVRLDFPEPPIRHYAPGIPGLIVARCDAEFEHFVFTRGWDEWGRAVRGWTDRTGKTIERVDSGLVLGDGDRAFKGDPMSRYEFSAQLDGPGGVYPVYVNVESFVRICADSAFTQLEIAGKRDGRDLPGRSLTIPARIHRARDAEGYHLRIVKLESRIVVFADGFEAGSIEGAWPESRPGLFAQGGRCVFDGIVCYELNDADGQP